MVEPTDGIVPMLHRIQADLTGLKSDVVGLKADVADIKLVLSRQSERLNEMNGYISFTLSTISPYRFAESSMRSNAVSRGWKPKPDVCCRIVSRIPDLHASARAGDPPVLMERPPFRTPEGSAPWPTNTT